MKLKLRNFQCHRNKELELKPLTFLTGPSNTGKSAYIRALGFLTGDLNVGANRLVTRGERQMSVTLEINGNVYERRVTKDGIECKYNDTIYPRMGINVPEEFKRLATIQFQFDPLFLITDSPTDVYKKVSQYIKMDTLLKIQELVQEDIKLYTRSLQLINQKIDDISRKLEVLKPYVEKAHFLILLMEIRRRITLLKGWKLVELLKRLRAVSVNLQIYTLSLKIMLQKSRTISYLLLRTCSLLRELRVKRLVLVLKELTLKRVLKLRKLEIVLRIERDRLLMKAQIPYIIKQYWLLQIEKYEYTYDILQKLQQIGICPVCKRKL